MRAGYHGEDSMRDKAEKLFREEDRGDISRGKQSASSKGTQKMRLYAKGGAVHHKMSEEQHDMVLPKRMKTPKLNIETMEEAEHFKKGGNVKHKKAAGGTVYEREMVGEKPTTKRPNINYEADMRGERPVKKAKKALGGAVSKLAIGGVGKIRHKEATKAGKQIAKRSPKGCAYK